MHQLLLKVFIILYSFSSSSQHQNHSTISASQLPSHSLSQLTPPLAHGQVSDTADDRAMYVPIGECERALKSTQRKHRRAWVARLCLKLGRCLLTKTGHLELTEGVAAIRQLLLAAMKDKVDPDEIETILSQSYSRQDWKLLGKWEDMKKSSVFVGHPTLKFQMTPIIGSTASNSSRAGASKKASQVTYQREPRSPSQSEALRDNGLGIYDQQCCQTRLTSNVDISASISSIYQMISSKLGRSKRRASKCQLKPPMKTLQYSICQPISPEERLVTFLEPLGSGKEAEVWRVCISSSTNSAEFLALKIYRRQYPHSSNTLPTHNPSTSHRLSTHPKDQNTEKFDSIWPRLVRSLQEALDSSALLPPSITLWPRSVWETRTTFGYSTPARHAAIARHPIYLGYGVAFDVADEVFCHVSSYRSSSL